MARRKGPAQVRGYGLTPWGRAFTAVFEAGADHRHLSGARRYFRDHHVERLDLGHAEIIASVRGSQLDPFEVILTPRPLDPPTVVDLLRRTGGIEALLALARGEQPAALTDLIVPTESADIASSCTCPDQAPRCIHVLAVAFELSAQIDKQPTTLLRILGTDLPDLLALAQDRSPGSVEGSPDSADRSLSSHDGSQSSLDRSLNPQDRSLNSQDRSLNSQDRSLSSVEGYYGDHTRLPAPPSFPRVDALGELDPAALRKALRASGLAATQVTEALDDLAELYAVLRDAR